MTEIETKEAMTAYKNGDTEAFTRLFEAYRNTVQNWCLRELQNLEDAEDVSQNVWLDLAKYLLQFEPSIHFKNIAYRVARNRSLDFIRNRDARAEILMSPEELSNLPIESQDRPDIDYEVNDMLKLLNSEDKALVIAKVYYGLSDEELAVNLGQSESTIRRQINRVFERLQVIHKEYEVNCSI